MAAKTDNFNSPDYFNVDELLLKIMHSVQNFHSKL